MEFWLSRAVALRPDAVALECDGRTLTYRQLAAEASARKPDVAWGERVPLAYEDRLEFALALHGALLARAAAVPIDLRLGAEELARRNRPGHAETPGTLSVMYTSGTTAEPKAVELTHGNWLANALGSAVMLGLDPQERWLCPMPVAHVGGLSILLRSTVYATTAVLHQHYETEAVLAELMDPARRITLVSLVPTMLARLLDAGLEHPPTLRHALLGGGPIPATLLRRAAEQGVPVAPSYGMTEACSQIATFGMPLPGVDLVTRGDGELLVRGPIVAPGAVGEDGWLHTGDLARFGDTGRLEIIGRKSDTIVSGGENVAPAEVEAVLLEHPAVQDAGVFARPDAEWGEAVIAKIVLRPGHQASPEELQAHASGRLARFKVPKSVEYAEELPRNPAGKLLRRQLM